MSLPRIALTVPEAAESVGVSKDRIRAAINSGKLRAKRDGRALMIPVTSLETWVDGLEDA